MTLGAAKWVPLNQPTNLVFHLKLKRHTHIHAHTHTHREAQDPQKDSSHPRHLVLRTSAAGAGEVICLLVLTSTADIEVAQPKTTTRNDKHTVGKPRVPHCP